MVPSEDEILTNLRRGTLEFCVLGALADSETYGLELARKLVADGPLLTSEGTLYPLLTRMRKVGWVDTTWRESATGPPRRYYRLTSDGRAALDTFVGVWGLYSGAVAQAVKGGAR